MADIYKLLKCSTAHLPPDFTEAMEKPLRERPASGGAVPYGFLIYAHDEDCGGTIGKTVMALFAEARRLGCDYVYFDEDAEPLDGFPVFDEVIA